MQKTKCLCSILLAVIFHTSCNGFPTDPGIQLNSSNEKLLDIYNLSDVQNNSEKNLYIVKAVVYEIGILTEVDDNDTSSEETHERVDLTFFDAHTNKSHIDLGNIPLPVQTNVSGQVLTGIAPINLGAFSNPSTLLNTLPLTGTIVNITHSDTAYFKLSTNNLTSDEETHFFNPADISQIPQVANSLSNLQNFVSRTNDSASKNKK